MRVVWGATAVLLVALEAQAASEMALQRPAQPFDAAAHARRERVLHARLAAVQVQAGTDRPLAITLGDADRALLAERPPRVGRLRVGVVKPLGARVDFSDLPAGPIPGTERSRPVGAMRGTGDGGYVWTAVIDSVEARALRLHLEHVRLPAGASLWVYGATGDAHGPYRGTGPVGGRRFWTHTIAGPTLVLQLEVPSHARSGVAPSFEISQVGHLGPAFPVGVAPAPEVGAGFCPFNEACIENVSCATVPAAIEAARDAMALIEFVSGAFLYICSGGLVADTDSTTKVPYFLTANHCLSRSREADSVEAFFQFSTSCGGACVGPNGVVPSTLGADVEATDKGADFTLLRLSEPAPDGSAFLGWTSTPVAFANGTALFRVSHPSGAPQAYSEHVVDTARVTCMSWPRGDRIYSSDVLGSTEPGSSGSPVLTATGQVVGQLSGACGTNVDDVCDAVSNATVDGAFAAYFAEVEAILDPGDPTTTTSSSSSTSTSTSSTTTTSSSSSSTSTTTTTTATSSSTSTSTTSTTLPSCVPGECNGDGDLTTADVTCTILRLFAQIPRASECEDCNADTVLTTADVTCAILCLFGTCS